MEKGVIAPGTILSDYSDVNKKLWAVGSFLRVNGIEETYEAASYNGKIPTDYPYVVKIVPHDNGSLPVEFQFYLDNAKPSEIDIWKKTNKVENVGMPVLLGSGDYKTNGQNYHFIVMVRYGKDLWSLFLENGRKFEPPTVYKIALQMLLVLKYIHSKSYVHGDIRGSNILVDAATQNHIYLVNYHFATRFAPFDDQVCPNEVHNAAIEYMSRDAYRGVPSVRGDMESLFYNLVQWLGLSFPWEVILEDPLSVQQQKENSFANVENFLKVWSKKTVIPSPIAEFMRQLATMDTTDKPTYWKFIRILDNGLKSHNQLRTGNLEFSINIGKQMEDSSQVNELKNRQELTCIPKLGISVVRLAKIISENCRCEEEVRIREVGPHSIIQTIYKLTGKKLKTLPNTLASAWEKDEAELKTLTRKLWELKAKEKTSREASKRENEDEDSPPIPSGSTQWTTVQANVDELNRNIPGSPISQSHLDAMSPNGMQENLDSFDLPNISPPNMHQALQVACSASLHHSDGSHTPVSRSSSHRSVQDDLHSQDLTPYNTPEQFFTNEHCRLSDVGVVGPEQEADNSDEQVTECWDCESWHDAYGLFNTWLDMKEKDLMSFDSIPSEPTTVTSLLQQVRVLLNDFHTQNLRLRQLKKVLAKLPPNLDDARKLELTEQRYSKQLVALEVHGKQLGDACLDQLRDALKEVESNLNDLPLVEESEEQLETIGEHLKSLHRELLVNAATVIEQLCQALDNSAFKSDLRDKLRYVKNLENNLQQRIDMKISENGSSLNDGSQLDDSCKRILVWLSKELDDLSKKSLVSTDGATLQNQHDHYKAVYQRIMDKQTEVMSMLKKNRLQNLENGNFSDHQIFFNSMQCQWNCLKKQSLEIFNKVNTCREHCSKYQQARKLLLDWLDETEDKLESLKPTSLNEIENVLKELSSLRNEVNQKSSELEQCANLGHLFVGACDEDTDDVVKNELIVMKDRWYKLNSELLQRTQSLDDMQSHLAEFVKSLRDLTGKIERSDNGLVSRDTAAVADTNSNLLHRMKELEIEMMSLQKSLDVVRQQADSLALKAREQGMDATSVFKAVNHMTGHIENVKTELVSTRDEILEQERVRSVIKLEESKPVVSHNRIKIEQSSMEIVTLESSDEDEVDISVAPAKQQHVESLLQQSYGLVQHAQAHEEKLDDAPTSGEQSSKAVKLERQSEERSLAKKIIDDDKSSNTKKKSKLQCRTSLDSVDSDSDCDERKMERKNSEMRKKKNDSDLSPSRDSSRKESSSKTSFKGSRDRRSQSKTSNSLGTRENYGSRANFSCSPRRKTSSERKSSKDSDNNYNSDVELRSLKNDRSRRDTLYSHHNKSNYDSDVRRPWRSSYKKFHWSLNCRQGYRSRAHYGTPNYYGSKFRQNNRWRSRSPSTNN